MTAHMGSKQKTNQLTNPTQTYQISKRSKRRMARFLEAYTGTNGQVVMSCKIANIDPKTFYNWYENLPEFKAKLIESEQAVFDQAYQTIIRKSKRGDVSASKYILKRDPRFKEEKTNDNRKIIINYPNWQ